MNGFPFIKFYPGDWRQDPAVRVCSLAARGLWVELLALMHQSEPYGHLMIGTAPIDAATLAKLVSASQEEVTALLQELETRGVFSRDKNGVIYSRRMVRDAFQRHIDSHNGKLGWQERLKRGGVKPPLKPKVNPPLKTPLKLRSQMLETRETSSAPGVRLLIESFQKQLATILGEKPATFNGGILAKLFTQELKNHSQQAIERRIGHWFSSDDFFIKNNGYSPTLFAKRFNLLKDGPIGVAGRANGAPTINPHANLKVFGSEAIS